MNVRMLGVSGSEVPGKNCPAFLLDDSVLLDAGTIGLTLSITEESAIRHIFLTHAHFDHIKAIPFLLDNLHIRGARHPVTIYSGAEIIDTLRRSIFNDKIWPDFTAIPSRENPALRFQTLETSRPVRIGPYTVVAERVHHTVPAFGYVVEDGSGGGVAYTGDTGPTDAFWNVVESRRPGLLIGEASFPNRLEEMALLTGHLTPALLDGELSKLRHIPRTVRAVHMKPRYLGEIEEELGRLRGGTIAAAREGETLTV